VFASLNKDRAEWTVVTGGPPDKCYIEGKNVLVEWRSAEGKPEKLFGIADELVRLRADILVTGGPAATGPAK
jgi:putative tryptophan/tyrosine transport system substrate-binding protein